MPRTKRTQSSVAMTHEISTALFKSCHSIDTYIYHSRLTESVVVVDDEWIRSETLC